jgi:hypothetical protein
VADEAHLHADLLWQHAPELRDFSHYWVSRLYRKFHATVYWLLTHRLATIRNGWEETEDEGFDNEDEE